MVRPYFHGAVASSAGGGPTVPLNLGVSLPGVASSQLKLTWSSPADHAGGITGYQIIKDGSVLVADTGSQAVTYTATGLTTSQSYSFQVAGISASGMGPPTAAVAKSTVAAASISYSGTATLYYAGTQNGYILYQFRGGGSFYVSSNPDSAPISVWAVGGGGGSYNAWAAGGGGGGGAVYWAKEITNFPVGSGHTMNISLGAGGSGTYTVGTATTVTNLYWNGSSWGTVTAGPGRFSNYGSASGGGAGSGGYGGAGSANNLAGTVGTTGTGSQVGGDGGTGEAVGNWSTGGAGGGGGGGGGVAYNATPPGKGGNGANAFTFGSGTYGYGGAGGASYAFTADEGFGNVNSGQGAYAGGFLMLEGIGGGGGGNAFGITSTGSCNRGQGGYGSHGGADSVMVGYRQGYGGFCSPSGYVPWQPANSDRVYHGQMYTGGGGSPSAQGYVLYGNGGSGSVYIRLHT